jgi:hypothetical protein
MMDPRGEGTDLDESNSWAWNKEIKLLSKFWST